MLIIFLWVLHGLDRVVFACQDKCTVEQNINMDAKTQISVFKQGCLNLVIEPTVEQIWDLIKQLQSEL